jgi:tetratricopeptide (TPR) repeat protein
MSRGQADIESLLLLAASRPREALANARAVLAARPGPLEASIARQAAGVVLRDFGDISAAVGELRAALRLARQSGVVDRETDVLATLGATLVAAGRTAAGLGAFDRAVRQAHGVLAGRVLLRRGIALGKLGRNRESLNDLRRAAAVLHRAGDVVWEARALTARADVHLVLGSTDRADGDYAAAGRLFAATSQELETAYVIHNRAQVAFRTGDLPAALSHFDEAARCYRLLGVVEPQLSIDLCTVLLAAGLPGDALGAADSAIAHLEHSGGQPTKRAELLLLAAGAALAGSDPGTALVRAREALGLFTAQRRDWWRTHAQFGVLRARHGTERASAGLLRSMESVAARLAALSSEEAPQAHVLAGRLALALGRLEDADRHLAVAARSRRRAPALSRATGWVAEALRAEAAADPRRLLNACRRGLDVLDEHRLTLGASELRAQATARGAELALLAQRQAVRAGSARLLLSWSERWRATTLAVPPVRPLDDRELATELAALREVTCRLDRARQAGGPAAALARDQRRLEEAVRGRMLRAPGTPGAGRQGLDLPGLLAGLGAVRLVQIVDVDGLLHVLVCAGGRVRHFAAGHSRDAARETGFVRFALRRLAHELGSGARDTIAVLEATGRNLEEVLLGKAARHLGGGPVVIVPPGRLHAVPWALLPSLRDRVLSVAPSARAWQRARAIPPPARRRVVVIRGPGLEAAGTEVPAVAGMFDKATVLEGGNASAAQALQAIDGAWLAHIAAHGTFRADSPLFSSLRLDDGPLTVYDFERLRRAPYRLVLPSCDSGLLAPAGADELLGLASSLLPLGTAAILASVVPLNDGAAASLMPELHRLLASGGTLSESLPAVCRGAEGDPLLLGTALSLVVLGAG